MNVSCPSCKTVFRVDPAKVPPDGVRARCTVCRTVFGVSPTGEDTATSPDTAAVPVSPPAAAPSAAAPASDAPTPTAPATPQPEAATPAAPTSSPGPVPPAPVGGPASVTRPAPAQAAPPPSTPPVVPPRRAQPAPGPVAAPRPAQPAARGAPGAAPAAAATPRAPVNPFLAQDPRQKARRLARALISDLVVYHPDKRQEGLRNGTLKDLFRDEIKKSWEEYTEQVGRDVAESTSYFNDALNEILGDGRKIF